MIRKDLPSPGKVREALEMARQNVADVESMLNKLVQTGISAYIPISHEIAEASDDLVRGIELLDKSFKEMC